MAHRRHVTNGSSESGCRWKTYLAVGVVAGLPLLTACGVTRPYGSSVERWRVMDSSTNPPAPVSNAAVLLTYEGTAFAPGHSSSTCVAAALVKSDGEGYFEVPAPQGGRRVRAHPYKPNHASPDIGPTAKGREVYLRANPATQSQLRYFDNLFAATTCSQLIDGSSAIVQFIDTLLPELIGLAKTPDSANTLALFREVRERRLKATLHGNVR